MLGDVKAVLLFLLDLSAAFDTLDHDLLLQRLAEIGISDVALAWMKSYRQGRKQFVRIK
jgi:hypothetical protein